MVFCVVRIVANRHVPDNHHIRNTSQLSRNTYGDTPPTLSECSVRRALWAKNGGRPANAETTPRTTRRPSAAPQIPERDYNTQKRIENRSFVPPLYPLNRTNKLTRYTPCQRVRRSRMLLVLVEDGWGGELCLKGGENGFIGGGGRHFLREVWVCFLGLLRRLQSQWARWGGLTMEYLLLSLNATRI